ncbi:C-type lectin domain family 4 member A-like isoform X2 [Archocentrus centrarchus]|uniref:C-type lectin domain family 4 member A-like isoform X2 n=1 Tax=Archocentrus centrarchus TaxID=63155 RepID=UPI0011EA3B9B|nr:C-type lectin domain family 4 member A-like isoform X2 [Archocentrus centrarchus]
MSTGFQAAPHVRYSGGVRAERGENEENEMEILNHEDQSINTALQKKSRCTKKKCSAAKRSHFRAIAAVLATFFLLILISTGIRYISVTLQRDQLQTSYNELKEQNYNLNKKYNELMKQCEGLSTSNSHSEVGLNKTSNATERGNTCPTGWLSVGCNCYYEFSVTTSLQDSNATCQRRGGTLLLVNSTEKQRILEGKTPEEALQCG